MTICSVRPSQHLFNEDEWENQEAASRGLMTHLQLQTCHPTVTDEWMHSMLHTTTSRTSLKFFSSVCLDYSWHCNTEKIKCFLGHKTLCCLLAGLQFQLCSKIIFELQGLSVIYKTQTKKYINTAWYLLGAIQHSVVVYNTDQRTSRKHHNICNRKSKKTENIINTSFPHTWMTLHIIITTGKLWDHSDIRVSESALYLYTIII